MKMKSLLTLLFTCLMIATYAQSSSSTQKTLITKRTATWCPNCGTWAWDMAKGVEELGKEDAILIRAHYSGDLQSQAAKDITENFDAVYQPEFYINEETQSVGSTTWSSKITAFGNIVDENSAKAADFSFELSSSFEGDMVSADVKVEVLNNVEGEYFLATYLLEDSVVANQASLGPSTVHNSILRIALDGKSFGSQIFDGAADAGSSANISISSTVEGDPLADRKFKVLAIVWKKENDKYSVANLHSVALSQVSSLKNTIKLADFLRYQRDQELNIVFDLPKKLNKGLVQIHGIDGRLLQLHSFTPQLGRNEIALSVNNWSGQFVVLSILGDGVLLHSDKVLLK